MGLSVERSRALYRQIKSEGSRLCGDARTRPILVVDEAHHLRPDVLEDPSAEEGIYQATGGLPRKINLLAHHTLLAAAVTRAMVATADHVQAALPEVA